jgi:hypothetical protein
MDVQGTVPGQIHNDYANGKLRKDIWEGTELNLFIKFEVGYISFMLNTYQYHGIIDLKSKTFEGQYYLV